MMRLRIKCEAYCIEKILSFDISFGSREFQPVICLLSASAEVAVIYKSPLIEFQQYDSRSSKEQNYEE